MLRAWTAAAARLTAGQTAEPLGDDIAVLPFGDALGLAPARLTLTFGFGAGLFVKEGATAMAWRRTGPRRWSICRGSTAISSSTPTPAAISRSRPAPTIPRSPFTRCGSSSRLAYGVAQVRWVQSGFLSKSPAGGTPRNLMGFKDGTRNPSRSRCGRLDRQDGPAWMRGGTYLVARRIRISLEHWDRTDVDFQEEVDGPAQVFRRAAGQKNESDAPDFDAADKDGNPSSPTPPISASPRRRPTAARRSCAAPTRTTTA